MIDYFWKDIGGTTNTIISEQKYLTKIGRQRGRKGEENWKVALSSFSARAFLLTIYEHSYLECNVIECLNQSPSSRTPPYSSQTDSSLEFYRMLSLVQIRDLISTCCGEVEQICTTRLNVLCTSKVLLKFAMLNERTAKCTNVLATISTVNLYFMSELNLSSQHIHLTMLALASPPCYAQP